MIEPISYLQTDSRWANKDYSAKGESTTIGKAGCGPTACAMVVATLADFLVTPYDACKWSKEHGYKALNQGTYYSFINAYLGAYGIQSAQLNSANIYGNLSAAAHKTALNQINAGNWVICCMGKGNWTSSGHFILWYGIDGDTVLIRDPNSTKAARVRSSLSLLRSQVKYYWSVNVQDFMKKDDEMIEDRIIDVFGKKLVVPGILKEGKNYLSVRLFEQLGFNVSNDKDRAVINMKDLNIHVNGQNVSFNGFSFNGTNYVSLRQLAESLGFTVNYDNESKKISIK